MVALLSQRDPRWESYPLGDVTLGSDGCAITSLAAIVGVDPTEVVKRLLAVGGLLHGKLIIWAKIKEAFPNTQVERVWSYDERANSQFPTMLEVDFDGTPRTDNKHWVVLLNRDQIMDPWTGTVESSSKYPLKTGYTLISTRMLSKFAMSNPL